MNGFEGSWQYLDTINYCKVLENLNTKSFKTFDIKASSISAIFKGVKKYILWSRWEH